MVDVHSLVQDTPDLEKAPLGILSFDDHLPSALEGKPDEFLLVLQVGFFGRSRHGKFQPVTQTLKDSRFATSPYADKTIHFRGKFETLPIKDTTLETNGSHPGVGLFLNGS